MMNCAGGLGGFAGFADHVDDGLADFGSLRLISASVSPDELRIDVVEDEDARAAAFVSRDEVPVMG